MRFPFAYASLSNMNTHSVRHYNADMAHRKFCNFIYSNGFSGKGAFLRQDFCKKLMMYKKVDCPGKILNNMKNAIEPRQGNWEAGKLEFMKNYKFSIAFENSLSDGYTTEKLLHPFRVDSIPIYWGNPRIGEEFNTKAFINCNDYESFDDVVEKVKELDANDDAYLDMLSQPILNSSYVDCSDEKLRAFLFHIVEKGRKPYEKNPHSLSEEVTLRDQNKRLKETIEKLAQEKSQAFPFVKVVVKNGCAKYYFLGIRVYKKKL